MTFAVTGTATRRNPGILNTLFCAGRDSALHATWRTTLQIVMLCLSFCAPQVFAQADQSVAQEAAAEIGADVMLVDVEESVAEQAQAEAMAEESSEELAEAPANEAFTSAEPVSETLAATPQAPSGPVKLDEEMEDVKSALVKLKRDLVILEEDLLFPASSQVSVFLSMDIGEFFQLDAVTVKLNGKEVAHHLYTEKQVDALQRGGVQKLFVGNVKQGDNRVTAFFTGLGPNGRDFRRATTVEFEKGFEPTFIELAISDETEDYQPDFVSAVSN